MEEKKFYDNKKAFGILASNFSSICLNTEKMILLMLDYFWLFALDVCN